MNDSQCSSYHRRLPAALLSLLVILGTVGPVLAVDGVIEINQVSNGGFINVSGSYRLTSDLQLPSGTSFFILADHVTFDLNGFSIVGPAAGVAANGISVQGSDVEIRNGTVRSFVGSGVFSISTVNSVRLIGVRSTNNQGSGIELQSVGNTVDGCTSASNGSLGIRADAGSIIMNSVARQNIGLGLFMSTTTGYISNIVTLNNGSNANPQTTGGIQLGSNLCGTDLVCP